MQTFVGMILGALLLVGGVYVYDSISDVERRRQSGAGQSHHRELGRRGGRLEGTEEPRP